MVVVTPFIEFTDVVVIGAGLSGLSCAASPLLKKLKIIVLEAQGRIGGRVHPVVDGHFKSLIPGMHIDLGAEFIHGDGHCLMDFAIKEKWKIKENFIWAHGDGGPSDKVAPDGGAGYYYSDSRLQRFDVLGEDLIRLRKELDFLCENDIPEDMKNSSLKEWLESRGLSNDAILMAEAGYANTLGASLDELNLGLTCRLERIWAEEEGGNHDFRICPSSRVLLDFMKRHAETNNASVRTGSRVVGVEDQGDMGVLVRYVTGEGRTRLVRSRYVVVTVPVTILQGKGNPAIERISFVPELPSEKAEAIQNLCVHSAIKMVVKFERRFWPADLHGVICADCRIPEFWPKNINDSISTSDESIQRPLATDCGFYCMIGFAAGRFAEDLSRLSESEILAIFIKQLDKVFGDKTASTAYMGGFVYDWSKVPFIRGGYSFPCIDEHPESRQLYARPEYDGKLHFAGEASDNIGAYMTMNSAISTGERSAKTIALEIEKKTFSCLVNEIERLK